MTDTTTLEDQVDHARAEALSLEADISFLKMQLDIANSDLQIISRALARVLETTQDALNEAFGVLAEHFFDSNTSEDVDASR